MKLLIILLTIILPFWVQGQIQIKKTNWKYEQPKLKAYMPSLIFTVLAGASDGLRDASMFHFQNKGSWWNGQESWKNKYRNGDPAQGPAFWGSTSFLVGFTDGAHAANMFTHQADAWAMVMMPADPNKKFLHLFLKTLIITTVRGTSHYLVYDVAFQGKR